MKAKTNRTIIPNRANRCITIVIFIIIAANLIFFSAGCAKKPDNRPRDIGSGSETAEQEKNTYQPVFCGFYTNGSGPSSSYPSLEEQWPYIQEISPLWYYVWGDGTIEEEIDQKALDLAREKNIKVIPLVALAYNRSSVVLTEPAARQVAVQNLLRVIRENNYDGINIDIEIVKSSGRDYTPEMDGFTQFIKELSEEMKPLGQRLDVCLITLVDPPTDAAQIYDYKAICGLADRAVIMAYDYHRKGTRPGPVAPLPWAEDNIKAALAAGYSPQQLSLGIPGYGYDWPENGTECDVAAMKDVSNLIEEKGLSVKWHDDSKTPSLAHANREIWFENDCSIEEKINLMKKYQLAGCSMWRLGYDNDSFWQVISSKGFKRVF
ncbi:MAG: glycosyl hydrolase family 18 protein [Desulfotomaculaceae bacterium]|nr:glycosyl hydrolase family 18 protein [Desulfotomaculaceae bacterium]